MAIPNVKPELPLRAKIRVGAKDARGNPTSLDHFVSDDETFAQLVGSDPRHLRIRFPYAEADRCFSSGLEKWMRGKKGPILGCYTKGDGTAHRLGKERDAAGLVVLDPRPPATRQSMPCAAQDCPYFGPAQSQGCRPVARLNFFLLDDARRDSVWRWETKSLNSIEVIEGVLAQYPDCRLPTFILSAERRSKKGKQYTVVTIAEAVDADPDGPDVSDSTAQRAELIRLLQVCGQDPRDAAVGKWVNQVGVPAAVIALRKRTAQAGQDGTAQ